MCLLMGLSACSWHFRKCDKQGSKTTRSEKKTVAQTSELTSLMRLMEKDLNQTKMALVKGEAKALMKDYSAIVTAKMSEGLSKSSQYDENASALLYRFVEFDARRDIPSFNNIVTACVHCHEQLNKKPLKRIQKLYLYN